MSITMLYRFREIIPSCLTLDDVISRNDVIGMVNVAFKIVGYTPRNLEKSVDSVIDNPKKYGIDFTKNQGSPVSISLGSPITENPKNLGTFFYKVWRVDTDG